MTFELGKTYIVDVTEKGIIPQEVFDRDRWYHKDYDDLDFLTDKEKIVVINDVLEKIRAEIEKLEYLNIEDGSGGYDKYIEQYEVLKILDKAESEK